MAARLAKTVDTAGEDERGTRAVQHWRRGELDKSIPLFEAMLKDQVQTLGQEHPKTRVTAANLGVNYKDAGRLAEAITLLEAARNAARMQKELRFSLPHLLEAYASAPEPAANITPAGLDMLTDEIVEFARDEYRPESPQLASILTQTSTWLVALKATDRAEPLVREALAVRERTQPDLWSTFNSRSMLGGILLRRGKLAEAEPLLIDGYTGMKQREATIPPQGKERLVEAINRLITLAETKGDAAAAERWRTERAARGDAGQRK
jgi:tetratricopeptide (TPR) repeat protein